jgi:hypothetical protein
MHERNICHWTFRATNDQTIIKQTLLITLNAFMFNEFRGEVIVRFVDIGEIVDHHCLSYL